MSYHKDLELFTIRPYRMKRLKPYFDRMSKDNLKPLMDDNVVDMLLAQGYHIEENPRSIYRVDKLYEALSGYAPGKIQNPKRSTVYSAGLSLAYNCFAKPKSRPYLDVLSMSPETVIKVTSNPGGSAGLTNYGCSKAASQLRALERGLQTLKGEKQPEPCLAFKRTQFNDKTRLVWGYPYSMTVIEGLLAHPLIQVFKKGTTPMAFAMASGALGSKLATSARRKEWAYSLDMSQFDATLSSELIHQAFKVLRTWFDPNQVEPTSGKTVREIFNLIEYYFIHTTIVMPDGNIYIGKDHGVPSGSYFTQMIDSVCNTIIMGTVSARFNLGIVKQDLFVLGDDILFWSNRDISLDVLARFASHSFGIRVHGSEKSGKYHFDQSVHFLGRDWDNGLPNLDEDAILARMAFPETFRRYSSDPSERKRQVHMMMLSFASVYRNAWSIAYDLVDGSHLYYHRGCSNVDVNTYIRGGGTDMRVDPDHLSGLARYRLKYLYNERSRDIPNTALQYWI